MKTIILPQFIDEAKLISTQDQYTIPFPIKRVFIISDIKRGTIRGRHAHRSCKQAIFCIQGVATIVLDTGTKKERRRFKKSNKGIFIDTMTWFEMRAFAPRTILLVFASERFRENDYIRSYKLFLNSRT